MSRATILLVEDDDLLRDSFEMLLDHAGYQVRTAGTADEALDTAREAQPALVILDLGLPDRSGLDVAREIRSDPELTGMRVVALTGSVSAAEEKAALEAGCDRFLAKPVPAKTLLEELAALV
jgi:DNA-binding response OmpR family regulator